MTARERKLHYWRKVTAWRSRRGPAAEGEIIIIEESVNGASPRRLYAGGVLEALKKGWHAMAETELLDARRESQVPK